MLNNQSMLLFVDIFLLSTSIGLLIPTTVLFIECSVALLSTSSEARDTEVPQPRIAVLIPAHDEASVIGVTLETLLPQLTTQDQLLVIADNCTDETAAIARKFGATVIERQDLERRGKGYALDYGLNFLQTDPPDVVVLVDADCIVEQGTVKRIAYVAATQGKPVQATYLMQQPANPSPKDSVSSLAFMVKNLVRPSGLARLGLPGLLTGSGMAFPWSVIRQAPLASGNIVEDMQLGLDLAIAGHPTLFCQDTKVIGILPQQEEAAKGQRTRWEHGHLQTLLTQVPRLTKASLAQRRFDLLALALDLSVPPLSLLVMIWLAATGLALLAGIWGATWIPLSLLAIAGVLILVSIVGAWAKFGRAEISAVTLLTIPFYILWKIPLYLAFLVQRQTKWIRTDRDVVDAR
ncbi:MAG: glycosyltransferase family 2 protein [Symploca sp. SIO2C1]|nr:glycosyltransferase family 2 protein [Symploca sp. SIO2C1]